MILRKVRTTFLPVLIVAIGEIYALMGIFASSSLETLRVPDNR
jgi:hypothetical protein